MKTNVDETLNMYKSLLGENIESYIQRLQKLEEITNSFPGVDNSFAIQAGREIRILVKPEKISDDDKDDTEKPRRIGFCVPEQNENTNGNDVAAVVKK